MCVCDGILNEQLTIWECGKTVGIYLENLQYFIATRKWTHLSAAIIRESKKGFKKMAGNHVDKYYIASTCELSCNEIV